MSVGLVKNTVNYIEQSNLIRVKRVKLKEALNTLSLSGGTWQS